jgi:DUF3047 family protein
MLIDYLTLNDMHTQKPTPLWSKTLYPLIAVILINLSLFPGQLQACSAAPDSNSIVVGKFSEGKLSNWKPIKFSKQTRYDFFDIETTRALRAYSHGTASGLIFKRKIDLHKTPLLHWCWRVDKTLSNGHEKLRGGDDFAARLYVVISGGYLPWRTKALNYVWTSQLSVNELWENPYGGKSTMMLAVRSNDSPSKTWFSEKRDVYKDLKRVFGSDIRYIHAVAIMTDTDDTAGTALTYYGDIYFSSNSAYRSP